MKIYKVLFKQHSTKCYDEQDIKIKEGDNPYESLIGIKLPIIGTQIYFAPETKEFLVNLCKEWFTVTLKGRYATTVSYLPTEV